MGGNKAVKFQIHPIAWKDPFHLLHGDEFEMTLN